MPTNTIISIIVVNWNTRELLRKCLSSIYATVPPIGIEVLVVDNASSDGSADMVANEFPDAMLVRNATNTGFATGNNLAIAKASGRYVMLLNPDAELLPGAVQAMLDFAESHPDVGVVGPKLLNTDESLQKNGRKFPTLARELLHITKLYKLAPAWFNRRHEWGREDFDSPAEVDEVCGACMLIRHTAINASGSLDERFFMYYEEVDLCLRIKKASFNTWYLPEAKVVHHSGQGTRQIGLAKNQMAYLSQYRYFLKHHGILRACILRMFSYLAVLAMRAKER